MLSTSLTVAAIQLNSQDDIAQNLQAAKVQVCRAVDRGAELVLLPENFAFFGADDDRCCVAEPPFSATNSDRAPIQRELASWARELEIVVIAGGMPVASSNPKRPYNSSLVFDAEGKLVSRYDKIHLFDVSLSDGTELRESAGTTPGADICVAELGGSKVGLSICYDLRFPELFRRQVEQGASVLTVPAAFTLQTGKDHWEVLLRARAIENQCWVVAAGQFGLHPKGRRCYGHSMVVDPWGAVVSRCSDTVGFAMATLEPSLLADVRARVPALQHRRLVG